MGELGATTGDIELGNAVEEAGVASCASTAGRAADADADATVGRTAGGGKAGDPAEVVRLVESADATLTGSATGADDADAATAVVDGKAAASSGAALTEAVEPAEAIFTGSATGADEPAAADFALEALGAIVAASTGPLPASAGLETADGAMELAEA